MPTQREVGLEASKLKWEDAWLPLTIGLAVLVAAAVIWLFVFALNHRTHYAGPRIDYAKVTNEMVVTYPGGRVVTLELNQVGNVLDASLQAPSTDSWRKPDGDSASSATLAVDSSEIHFPKFDGQVYFDQHTRAVTFAGNDQLTRILKVDGSMIDDDRHDLSRERVVIRYPGGATRTVVLSYGSIKSVLFDSGLATGSTTCMLATKEFEVFSSGVMPAGVSDPSQCQANGSLSAVLDIDGDYTFTVTKYKPGDDPKAMMVVDKFYTSGNVEARRYLNQ